MPLLGWAKLRLGRRLDSGATSLSQEAEPDRGGVTGRNQAHGWFRMHTTSNQRVRIWTTRSTHWDDCDWGDMSYGHHVDARAYRSHGRWMASAMDNWHDWDERDTMMGR